MYYLILNLDNNSSKILMCLRGVSNISFPGNINAKILIHHKNDLLISFWVYSFLCCILVDVIFITFLIIIYFKTFWIWLWISTLYNIFFFFSQYIPNINLAAVVYSYLHFLQENIAQLSIYSSSFCGGKV